MGKTPGSSLVSRLASRGGGAGIYRRSMPDGGEVYSGPVARQALRAVGARAMTMDSTIIVDENFDVSNPADAALYAHESFHADMAQAGASDANTGAGSGEEIAARKIERMVYHRSAMGGNANLGQVMRDAREAVMRKAGQSSGAVQSGPAGEARADEHLMEVYQALKTSGMTHELIVQNLATYVNRAIAEMNDNFNYRRSLSKTI